MNNDILKDKTLLITGGTGSFGNAVLNKFLESNIKEIRIFSRDEKKQDDQRKKYNNSKLKFYVGDIRDYGSIFEATRCVDYIFHAAALKQVPSCEFYPMEAVKTNILGSCNVIDAAIHNSVSKLVLLSTDKAVYPVNAMGISKAMMEKLVSSKSRNNQDASTVICATRYGNVMNSRGSVIPLFVEQLRANAPLTITDPEMTRFMMTLDEAVDLVMFAFENGKSGDIFVQKSPAATIGDLASAICKYFGKSNYPIDIIGTRHGEKLYEVLLSREEKASSEEIGNYYRIKPDSRNLNYENFVSVGDKHISTFDDYNSHNTYRLEENEIINLLEKISFN